MKNIGVEPLRPRNLLNYIERRINVKLRCSQEIVCRFRSRIVLNFRYGFILECGDSRLLFRNRLLDFLNSRQFFLGRKRMFMPVLDRTHFSFIKRLGTFENRCKRVVIGLLNGVKFVVVTSHTSKRHTKEDFSDRVQLLVNRVHLELVAIPLS